jgi:hypothetical protein
MGWIMQEAAFMPNDEQIVEQRRRDEEECPFCGWTDGEHADGCPYGQDAQFGSERFAPMNE